MLSNEQPVDQSSTDNKCVVEEETDIVPYDSRIETLLRQKSGELCDQIKAERKAAKIKLFVKHKNDMISETRRQVSYLGWTSVVALVLILVTSASHLVVQEPALVMTVTLLAIVGGLYYANYIRHNRNGPFDQSFYISIGFIIVSCVGIVAVFMYMSQDVFDVYGIKEKQNLLQKDYAPCHEEYDKYLQTPKAKNTYAPKSFQQMSVNETEFRKVMQDEPCFKEILRQEKLISELEKNETAERGTVEGMTKVFEIVLKGVVKSSSQAATIGVGFYMFSLFVLTFFTYFIAPCLLERFNWILIDIETLASLKHYAIGLCTILMGSYWWNDTVATEIKRFLKSSAGVFWPGFEMALLIAACWFLLRFADEYLTWSKRIKLALKTVSVLGGVWTYVATLWNNYSVIGSVFWFVYEHVTGWYSPSLDVLPGK